ncbi:MAG: hypothetical protein ISP90_01940 [Nevskia sp.]|nr:hypothetical protein [Nevskia sp.]
MAACLWLAAPAWAQAPEGGAAPQPAAAADQGIGTTIVGDKETPMGLYLTPWKNVHPERGLERPPQLLDEELTPVDPKVFHRRVYYFEKLAEQRKLETGAGK